MTDSADNTNTFDFDPATQPPGMDVPPYEVNPAVRSSPELAEDWRQPDAHHPVLKITDGCVVRV